MILSPIRMMCHINVRLIPPSPLYTHPDHTSQAFVGATRPGALSGPLMAQMPPPDMAAAASSSLSVVDRCRIRDRSTILARHMFAEQGTAFADQQVGWSVDHIYIDRQYEGADLYA